MFYVLGVLLLVIGVHLLILGSRLYYQPRVGDQISFWNYTLHIPNEPPKRFYARLYHTIKDSLEDRFADGDGSRVEVILTGMGFGPMRLFAAPSLFAQRPLYLLVRYRHLKYYIFAGQSPIGLFISSWCFVDHGMGILEILKIAPLIRRFHYSSPQTLFQFDATVMFQEGIHALLIDTVKTYLQETNLKPMEAMEQRPILHAFYKNPFQRKAIAPDTANTFAHSASNNQPPQVFTMPPPPDNTQAQATPQQVPADANGGPHNEPEPDRSAPQASPGTAGVPPAAPVNDDFSSYPITVIGHVDDIPKTPEQEPPSKPPSGLFTMDNWMRDKFGRKGSDESGEGGDKQ